jgi:hypothetical protein
MIFWAGKTSRPVLQERQEHGCWIEILRVIPVSRSRLIDDGIELKEELEGG